VGEAHFIIFCKHLMESDLDSMVERQRDVREEPMGGATATIVDLTQYREQRAQKAKATGSPYAATGAGVFFFVMPVPMVAMWPTFLPCAGFIPETRNE
jgi:hypothetical protein